MLNFILISQNFTGTPVPIKNPFLLQHQCKCSVIQASSYKALFCPISLVKEILTPPLRMTLILFPLLLPPERERMERERVMCHFSKSPRWDSGHIIKSLQGARLYRNFIPVSYSFSKETSKILVYWSVSKSVTFVLTLFFFAVRSREKAIFKIKRKLAFDNRRCESHCVRSVFVDKRKEERKSNI